MDTVNNREIQLSPNMKRGSIPQIIYKTAQDQGLDPDEIWGVYLPPGDPRNPKSESGYFGLSEIDTKGAYLRINKVIKTLDENNTDQKQWVDFLSRVKNQSEPGLMNFVDTGLKVVANHEITHKIQLDEFSYTTLILSTLEPVTKAPNEQVRQRILSRRNDVSLTAEIQALSAQFLLPEVDPKEIRDFNVFWFAKTFSLFNNTASTGVKLIDNLYSKFANSNDFTFGMPNAFGIASRALFLCDSPFRTLQGIRSGKISLTDFKKQINIGLKRIISGSPEENLVRCKEIYNTANQPLKDSMDALKGLL